MTHIHAQAALRAAAFSALLSALDCRITLEFKAIYRPGFSLRNPGAISGRLEFSPLHGRAHAGDRSGLFALPDELLLERHDQETAQRH